ncbi:MAG: hypothetical protein U9R08_04605 [Nanoarchaeota archaeon]|nr:hypothetical protein [Nanoarchaeota archaeon]
MVKKRGYEVNSRLILALIIIWIAITISSFSILLKQPEIVGHTAAANILLNVVRPESSLYTEHEIYSPGINISILGSHFTDDGLIEFYILNSTGSVIANYPINLSTDGSGSFNTIWDTCGMAYDNYTLLAKDLNEYTNNRDKIIEILPPYEAFGRLVEAPNKTGDGEILVYRDSDDRLIAIDDEIYNLSFLWGMSYTIEINPYNYRGLDKIIFYDFINVGTIGDFLGIDSIDERKWNRLVVVNPLITHFSNMEVQLSFDNSQGFQLFKCLNWNFTERYCNDDNWTVLANLTNGSRSTTIFLEPADPGLGIGPNPITRAASRASSFSPSNPPPTCEEFWICGEWSICVDGKQTRNCYDSNKCDKLVAEGKILKVMRKTKPVDSRSCDSGFIESVQPINIEKPGLWIPIPFFNLLLVVAILSVILITVYTGFRRFKTKDFNNKK